MSSELEIVPLLRVDIRAEPDIVTARQHARQFAAELGFDLQSQTRISTAVSEIARNAYQYANGGSVEYIVEAENDGTRRHEYRRQTLIIVIRDQGPGIKDLQTVLSGNYRSTTGMGVGIIGARRLMDSVEIESSAAGTAITLRKNLPAKVTRKSPAELKKLAVEDTPKPSSHHLINEVQLQNQELVRVMEEVNQRQEELAQLNTELEQTNAGVLALYDELETLHRVGLLLASKVDQSAVIQALIEATTDLTGAEFGACYLRSGTHNIWKRYASAGPQKDLLKGLREEEGADFFGTDFGADGMVHIPDHSVHTEPCCCSKFAEALLPGVTLRSCLTVALVDADQVVIGALIFGSSVPCLFSERSERIVSSIAIQAVVAIDKARLYDSVKASSEAKDKFLAMISHELRTPLNPVLSIISGLNQDASLPPAFREEIAIVLRNVQLEARLIDDLLDFHRIIKGNIEFAREPVDVHAMIRNVVEICRTDVAGSSHHLQTLLESPRFTVEGDAARLQQVLWNVLKNAIKFTPSGGLLLIRTAMEEPATLHISITDNGRGIEPDLLQGIFGAFEQGSVEGMTQFGGLGLGLAIAKAFVEKHGGSVVAQSAGRGHGTTIEIRLPLADTDVLNLVDAAALPPSASSPQSGSLSILLIDDHADTLWSLSRLLVRRGYTVTTAVDCAEARAHAARTVFDLIISDLGLPDGSGHDLMREIRKSHATPAIALSGYGMESDVSQTKEAGFELHLTKPVDFQSLLRSIETLTQSAA
ncbi:MAG: ATP-binding protein [Verrucomicrobiota bacterium]